MKQRKPRTKSVDLNFDGAHQFGKPIHNGESPAVKKLDKRLRAGLCLGCGFKKPDCKCKSVKL